MLEQKIDELIVSIENLREAIETEKPAKPVKLAKTAKQEAENDEEEIICEEEEEVEVKEPPKKRGRKPRSAGPSISTVRKRFRELIEAAGRNAAVGVLEEFDVKNVNKLAEEDYPAVLEAIDAAMEEAEEAA